MYFLIKTQYNVISVGDGFGASHLENVMSFKSEPSKIFPADAADTPVILVCIAAIALFIMGII